MFWFVISFIYKKKTKKGEKKELIFFWPQQTTERQQENHIPKCCQMKGAKPWILVLLFSRFRQCRRGKSYFRTEKKARWLHKPCRYVPRVDLFTLQPQAKQDICSESLDRIPNSEKWSESQQQLNFLSCPIYLGHSVDDMTSANM